MASELDQLERVCPSCRQPVAAFVDIPPPSGTVPRCPEHGLAFVERHELAVSDGDPLLGRTVAGRFTILGRIGRGSMGSVYRARQEAMRRDVALKIVRRDRAYDPETKGRFEREARAISSLTSQHTITAFDFGEAEDGSWYLAMEMLEGETVGDRLRRERRIDWLDAVRFARDALKSLAEAHGKGIIHRDLKPDNLFLVRLPEEGGQRREICKVLDFGIAKWQGGPEQAPIDQLETQAGTVFGTPRYMSPEQAQGVGLDPRSDLYSLGVLLYQMLTGRAPFVDDDAVVVMARHIKDMPPPFSEVAADAKVPAAIEQVVFRTLAKIPSDRPQSAEQMSAELDAAVESARAATSGVQSALAETAAAANTRGGRLLALGAALALGVIALAVYALLLRPEAEPTPAPAAPARGASVVVEEPAGANVTSDTTASTHTATEAARAPAEPSQPESSSVGDATIESSTANNVRAGAKARPVRSQPASSAPRLTRKRNERYGRFD
ncbi:MAG: serine/threonine protein kinase [Myxococcota bacterium]